MAGPLQRQHGCVRQGTILVGEPEQAEVGEVAMEEDPQLVKLARLERASSRESTRRRETGGGRGANGREDPFSDRDKSAQGSRRWEGNRRRELSTRGHFGQAGASDEKVSRSSTSGED